MKGSMPKRTLRSIGAVFAGFALIIVPAFGTDTALQLAGVLPVTGTQRFGTGHSLLALSYHLAYALVGCYVAAWLAPNRPMAHAMALGAIGVVISVLGLVAIIKGDLAPSWYGWALVLLSLPVAWVAGKLFSLMRGRATT